MSRQIVSGNMEAFSVMYGTREERDNAKGIGQEGSPLAAEKR